MANVVIVENVLMLVRWVRSVESNFPIPQKATHDFVLAKVSKNVWMLTLVEIIGTVLQERSVAGMSAVYAWQYVPKHILKRKIGRIPWLDFPQKHTPQLSMSKELWNG